MIRPARARDIDRLRQIERAAGQAFAEIGMTSVAEDEPPSAEELGRYLDQGLAWVHIRGDDLPIAYILVDLVDGNAHVEQVSVHPDSRGEAIGRGLVEHVAQWATAHHLPALTLTTFRHVAWNGPYYERCGFRWLTDPEITPGLRALRMTEATHGLDRWPRGCMRRDLR